MVGDDRLGVAVEELQDLKGVWVELSKVSEQLDELKDKPWLSVQPRKVCTNILSSICASIPPYYRYVKLLMVY